MIAPTSALTALLYYFGWVRTSVEARELGLDESLLGYSTQDYLLRSMSSMFAPLVLVLVTILVGVGFHAAVTLWAREKPEARLGRLVASVASFGLALLAVGVAGTRLARPSPALYVGAPVCVTLGIVVLTYAATLWRRRRQRALAPLASEMDVYNPVVTTCIVMLLMLSLFWNASHYAVVKGRSLASTVEAVLPDRPGTIVYSEKRLYLQTPVVETRLDPDNAAYNYAYTGLKLLFRSGGKYFLRPSDPASRVNIIIPDELEIRLELFSP